MTKYFVETKTETFELEVPEGDDIRVLYEGSGFCDSGDRFLKIVKRTVHHIKDDGHMDVDYDDSIIAFYSNVTQFRAESVEKQTPESV